MDLAAWKAAIDFADLRAEMEDLPFAERRREFGLVVALLLERVGDSETRVVEVFLLAELQTLAHAFHLRIGLFGEVVDALHS